MCPMPGDLALRQTLLPSSAVVLLSLSLERSCVVSVLGEETKALSKLLTVAI